MARLINGANGPFIGKAGSFIGYTVNGVAYMKGNYKKRTKPPTAGELLNREKFSVAQDWLKPLKGFVIRGFKGYNTRFQGFAAAKSWLMKNAMDVVDGKVIIDPSRMKVSSGSLPLPADLSCTLDETMIFRFSWRPNEWSTLEKEHVMALVYVPERMDAYGCVYGNGKSEGVQLVDVERYPGGATYHCYMAFTATDGSKQSDSVYMGSFEF